MNDAEAAAALKEYRATREALRSLEQKQRLAEQQLREIVSHLSLGYLKGHSAPSPGLSYEEREVTYPGVEELALLLVEIKEKKARYEELKGKLRV